MFLPVALEGPCRHHAERETLPGGDASGARQGRSQDSGKATVQTNKASLFSALHFPPLPCGRYAPVRAIRFLPQHAKSSLKRELFSCAAASGRSARNKGRAGGVAGIFAVARRPPSVRYHDRIVVAHPPITRAGDGRKDGEQWRSSRASSDRMAAADHSRRNEGSCGQRQPG